MPGHEDMHKQDVSREMEGCINKEQEWDWKNYTHEQGMYKHVCLKIDG